MTQPSTASVSGQGGRAGHGRAPSPGAGERAGTGGAPLGGGSGPPARPRRPPRPPGVCARPARPAARARGERAASPGARGLGGRQARGAGSLTGLRRFSVTFFQSSSCSWCRKPMAGPRSGRLRAAARSSARPASPAACRAARHRPRGGGVSAPGTGCTLAPPRRPRRQPLAPAPRPHRPRLKALRRVRRAASCPGTPPGAPPAPPGGSWSSTRPGEASCSPPCRRALRVTCPRAHIPTQTPASPLPGRSSPRVTRPGRNPPPSPSDPPAGAPAGGDWPRGRPAGMRGAVRTPPGHHLRPPPSQQCWRQELHPDRRARSQSLRAAGAAATFGLGRSHLCRAATALKAQSQHSAP